MQSTARFLGKALSALSGEYFDQGTKTMLKTEHKHEPRIYSIHALRVNVKSLAAEARLIRQETERAGPAYRDALAFHRRGRLRAEARYAQLALAFFRKRPYRSVEQKCFQAPDLKRLTEKIRRFEWGYGTNESEVADWLK